LPDGFEAFLLGVPRVVESVSEFVRVLEIESYPFQISIPLSNAWHVGLDLPVDALTRPSRTGESCLL
jgi:hypothetical protein